MLPKYIKLGRGITVSLRPTVRAQPRQDTNVINVLALITNSTQFLHRRKRSYLKIINYSPNPIYYNFDTPASKDSGIFLQSGTYDEYLNTPYAALYVIATVVNANIQIVESF